MALLTKEAFTAEAQSHARNMAFSDVLKSAKVENKQSNPISIFLSHSHLDKDMIEAGIVFFRNLNVNIYVDWADTTMPQSTNAITAANIKKQIDGNKKFILLATNNAVASKWCNWELGIGDVKKLPLDNLAIIPLADNNGEWKGNEYLHIYPHIERAVIDTTRFKVMYPDREFIYLDEWIKKK